MTTSEESNWDKTLRVTSANKALYPDVPQLSSTKFFAMVQQQQQQKEGKKDYILVDIRPENERAVSIIPGSVPVKTFEEEMVADLKPETKVIVHCTWSFRSGHEARRLRNQYKISNLCHLDGIVAYTFVPGAQLVDKETNQPVKQVQVIREAWAHPAEGYTPVYFEGLELFIGSMLVVGTFFLRNVQNWIHGKRFGHVKLKED